MKMKNKEPSNLYEIRQAHEELAKIPLQERNDKWYAEWNKLTKLREAIISASTVQQKGN